MRNKKLQPLHHSSRIKSENHRNRRKIDSPNTHIHDCSLTWLDSPNTHIHDYSLTWLDSPNTHIHDCSLTWLDSPNTHIHDCSLTWLATGWWFSPGTSVSSTNKTDCHDITEILLKVALNTINQTNHHLAWYYKKWWG